MPFSRAYGPEETLLKHSAAVAEAAGASSNQKEIAWQPPSPCR